MNFFVSCKDSKRPVPLFPSLPSVKESWRENKGLLILDGARFMDLILQSPEISFEIFKVLTHRLRKAEELLRAQQDEERDSSR